MNARANAALIGTSVNRAKPRKFGRMKLHPIRVSRQARGRRGALGDGSAVGACCVITWAMVVLRDSLCCAQQSGRAPTGARRPSLS